MIETRHRFVLEQGIGIQALLIPDMDSVTELNPASSIHWFCLSGIHAPSMTTAAIVFFGEQFFSIASLGEEWDGTEPSMDVWMYDIRFSQKFMYDNSAAYDKPMRINFSTILRTTRENLFCVLIAELVKCDT